MNFSFVTVLLVFLGASEKCLSREIPCEGSVREALFGGVGGSIYVRTCSMIPNTFINSTGSSIAGPKDESMLGLWLHHNEKILFLPERVKEKYPNLQAIEASYCSISSVSRKNFDGLKKLRLLRLGSNQIEIIESDTFLDLPLLESIDLSQNKINFLNGDTFKSLSKLKFVGLARNSCINMYFNNKTLMETLEQEVSDNCGYSKEVLLINDLKVTLNDALNEIRQEQMRASSEDKKTCLETEKIFKDILKKQSDSLTNKTSEITDLKVKLAVAEIKAENQLTLKLKEIEELRNELEKLRLENNEKDLKIQKLNEKIKIMSDP